MAGVDDECTNRGEVVGFFNALYIRARRHDFAYVGVAKLHKGNFIEQLYQAVARRFVVSSRFTWNQENLEATLRDQVALAQLAELGERLQCDAAHLIDTAMTKGTEIPSVSAIAEVRFENQAARARFFEEYMDALQKLLNKHGGTTGEAFRVAFAAYPERENE